MREEGVEDTIPVVGGRVIDKGAHSELKVTPSGVFRVEYPEEDTPPFLLPKDGRGVLDTTDEKGGLGWFKKEDKKK